MKSRLAKLLALALTPALLLGTCAGCGNTAKQPEITDPSTEPAPTVSQAAIDALDGKKILFIGNSFTHHGYCVMFKQESVLTQAERSGDQGYFYQLCKRNGAEVSVTNWCFGGHDITHTFGGAECTMNKDCKGQIHENFLTDRVFDYVAIQFSAEKQYAGNMMEHMKYVMDFFREANPNVKFLFLVPHMAYDQNYAWHKDVEQLKGEDIIVCNWGKMLHDIVQGTVKVPGATQTYARPTFVISADENDGYHQNLLAGYITTVMVYSAITGDSAVGQPYDFCNDSTIDQRFNFDNFKAKKYAYEPYTNFVEVFESEADMKGLQQLVDQYIKEYNP